MVLISRKAVHSANWSAGYDIRVNMQTKETPVTLIYKAAITQSTGEVDFLMSFLTSLTLSQSPGKMFL
jgi:hypothetical protein